MAAIKPIKLKLLKKYQSAPKGAIITVSDTSAAIKKFICFNCGYENEEEDLLQFYEKDHCYNCYSLLNNKFGWWCFND